MSIQAKVNSRIFMKLEWRSVNIYTKRAIYGFTYLTGHNPHLKYHVLSSDTNVPNPFYGFCAT